MRMPERPARLLRPFFARPADELAPAVLGRRLVRILPDGTRLAGTIVEAEAYVGVGDRACHSFNHRRTPRVEAMYGPPGTAYVYLTYGMHWMLNLVCGEPGEPVAVLLRAIQPTQGLNAMRRHRASAPKSPPDIVDRDLCRGPARLCQALAVDLALNAVDLTASRELWLEAGESVPREQIARTPRIGVASAGKPWADAPLRFVIGESPWASGPRTRLSPNEIIRRPG
jgi:DNA-3-methyladenine glycosylase